MSASERKLLKKKTNQRRALRSAAWIKEKLPSASFAFRYLLNGNLASDTLTAQSLRSLQQISGNRAVQRLVEVLQFQYGVPPKKEGLVKPTKKTQRLIDLAKLFKREIEKPISPAVREGLIVQILKNMSSKKLEDFNWIYQREHTIGLVEEIENLISTGKLDAKIKKRLPALWSGKSERKADRLNESQRKQAVAIAAGLKGKWPAQWVQSDTLAKWMFNEKVWQRLCGAFGGGVEYPKEYIGGGQTTWLFTTPEETQVARWQNGGAEEFLRKIAMNIDKQLYDFSKDIGWLKSEWGTRQVGIQIIVGLKTKIRKYQAAWEAIGKGTGTLGDIKSMLPGDFMKYLWSEEERKKLPLWKTAT